MNIERAIETPLVLRFVGGGDSISEPNPPHPSTSWWTMTSVIYLHWRLNTHKVTAAKLTAAAGFYAMFAAALAFTL